MLFYIFSVAVSGGMAGGRGGGGWGFTGVQQVPPMSAQQQKYEAMFNSLFPKNGMVTGRRMGRDGCG